MSEFDLFSDQIDGYPLSWNWSFGNGHTSTIRNPVYQYIGAGNYSVSLSALNHAGSNSTTRTNYLTVGSSGLKMAAISSGAELSGLVVTEKAIADYPELNATLRQKMAFVDKNTSVIRIPVNDSSVTNTEIET